jgi:ribosomal protein L12E/L44/L45/RPP1/RPP2
MFQLVAKGKLQGRVRFKLFGKPGHEVLKDKVGKFLQVTCPKVNASDSDHSALVSPFSPANLDDALSPSGSSVGSAAAAASSPVANTANSSKKWHELD